MSKIVSFFAAVTISATSVSIHAQSENELWSLMNAHAISTTSCPEREIPGRKLVRWEMQFASAEWKGAQAALPAGVVVERVELISTLCAEDSSFAQDRLDRSRLHALKLRMPSLLDDPRTGWERVHVTESAGNSRKVFHGFIITYRVPPTEESVKEEIRLLRETFFPAAKTRVAGESLDFKITRFVSGTGKIYYEMPSLIFTDGAAFPSSVYSGNGDSTVTSVLVRNRQWKEMLVVCDITGSMSPYTAQLLAWFRLNTTNGRVKNFVFFNDGDNKPDGEKRAGSTGGIYGVSASHFDTVTSTALFAMRQGCGGDAPENNVEALSFGLKQYGDAEEVVMIADNWATPRDLAFAESINRPVRIIVCGGAFGINTAYLDLARKTGGSVHTMEQDLTDLALLHEGETITIGAFTYKLEGGKFIPLRKS